MKIKLFSILFFISVFASAQNTWTQKANFGGAPRYGGIGFSIGNYGYIGMGWTGAYQYDF